MLTLSIIKRSLVDESSKRWETRRKKLVFLFNDHLIGSPYSSLQLPVESKYNSVDYFYPRLEPQIESIVTRGTINSVEN